MKWGLLIVGIHGASASTLAAGLSLNLKRSRDFCSGSYWCAIATDYPSEVYSLKVGGWDYRYDDLTEAVSANTILSTERPATADLYSAIIGSSDYAARVEGRAATHPSLEAGIVQARTDICDFRRRHDLDRVIIINSSSPMYCGVERDTGWASATAYSNAAIEEGCDWVEFSPSDSVTSALIDRATKSGSRIAGRDGSTGQTILKLLLRDFFQSRGLSIQSWYSTNLIGNRDGLVLSHEDYNLTKFRDKKSVLKLESNAADKHIVEIQFVEPAGDNKESWDCVFFRGWKDKLMSMRINWHGADSYLAAPLMLDIVSGLILAHRKNRPPGLVSALGLFFKSPLGVDNPTYELLQSEFRHFVLE